MNVLRRRICISLLFWQYKDTVEPKTLVPHVFKQNAFLGFDELQLNKQYLKTNNIKLRGQRIRSEQRTVMPKCSIIYDYSDFRSQRRSFSTRNPGIDKQFHNIIIFNQFQSKAELFINIRSGIQTLEIHKKSFFTLNTLLTPVPP